MTVREERFGDFTLVTVSDTGADHLARRVPNQDAAAFRRMGEDFVLAVSDGVGSCSLAGLGANYAVSACVKVLEGIKKQSVPFENGPMLHVLLENWRTFIRNGEPDDYCATLQAVFRLGGVVKVLSVGDGFTVLTSGGVRLLSPVDETDFLNETKCLNARIRPEDFWTADFFLDTNQPFVFLCCTDGVANGLIPGTEVSLAEEIERKIPASELAGALREFLADISNYCSDDKTVGVVKYA